MITLAQTQQALAIAIGADIPVLMWGGPGVGKSTIAREIARKHGWHAEILLLSRRDPTEVCGTQFINAAADEAVLVPPTYLRQMQAAAERGQRSLLVFDELTTASSVLQGVGLAVILDRIVGDTPLPAGTRVLAAANPPEQAAGGGYDLDPPMANRFLHLKYAPSSRDIADGFLYGWTAPEIPELDEDAFLKEIAGARLLVGGFLAGAPMLANLCPVNNPTKAGQAWPSPRTWDMAARALGAARAANADDSVTRLLVNGCVGDVAGGQFLEYLRALDLPDIEQVLNGTHVLDLPMRGDRAFVICAGLLGAVADDTTPKRWIQLANVLAQFARKGHEEIAVSYGKRLLGKHPHDLDKPKADQRNFRPSIAPIPKDITEAIMPILIDANMTQKPGGHR